MGFDLKIGTTNVGQLDNSKFAMNSIGDEAESKSTNTTTLKMKKGDSVNISDEGIQKSNDAGGKTAKEVAQEAAGEDQTEKMIRKRIKELEKELKELRQNPEQNEKAIKMKEQELDQYQSMLMDILNKKKSGSSGGGVGGGTRAQTADNSLTEIPKGMLCEVRF